MPVLYLDLILLLGACAGDAKDSSATDGDGDGFSAATDCDDDDGSVHPDAPEVCNDADDDCDGETDRDATDAGTWYSDVDGDGFGADTKADVACSAPAGAIGEGGDCADHDARVYPGATETCNGADDDCDGVADDDAVDGTVWYADTDGDGYGSIDAPATLCAGEDGFVGNTEDCDDDRADVSPVATEVCGDGADNDCRGADGGCRLPASVSVSDADAQIFGSAERVSAGRSLAFDDLDGDGFAEVILTVLGNSRPERNGGGRIFSGPLRGEYESDAPTVFILGNEAEDIADSAASFVVAPGDLDGDGWRDLVFGSGGNRDVCEGCGAVYLAKGPFSEDRLLADAPLGMIYGNDALSELGSDGASAGDVDGDGLADILLVSRLANDTRGAVYLFRGPASGMLTASNADATWFGDWPEGYTSLSADGAGDVTGDGLDDVLVGFQFTVEHADGVVYLYEGPCTGVGDLSDSAAEITASYEDSGIGLDVSGPGDLNNDGYADVLVRTQNIYEDGEYREGGVLVFEGPLSGLEDLASASAELSSGTGEGDQDGLGATMEPAGDTDGDGNNDLVFGSADADEGGGAFLAYGPFLGFTSLDATAVYFEPGYFSGRFGDSVAGGADVDGDGLPDILIADSAYDEMDAQGAVYLFQGSGE